MSRVANPNYIGRSFRAKNDYISDATRDDNRDQRKKRNERGVGENKTRTVQIAIESATSETTAVIMEMIGKDLIDPDGRQISIPLASNIISRLGGIEKITNRKQFRSAIHRAIFASVYEYYGLDAGQLNASKTARMAAGMAQHLIFND
ncbi:MAG: hypothetical protein ACYC9R_12855 [Nitrosotalea sp.]